MTPAEHTAAILAAAQRAAATRQASIVARSDCVKVLRLLRDYEGAALLERCDDETYGAIIAQASGPAKGPKTPPGGPIDLDARDPRGRA